MGERGGRGGGGSGRGEEGGGGGGRIRGRAGVDLDVPGMQRTCGKEAGTSVTGLVSVTGS